MALTDKHDLGIHTEMFTDAVVDLVEAGVVTGAAKERNRGKIVTAFVMGSPRLYEFVHDNPMVEMRPVDFTNDTHVIRSFSRMVSINSAIEVDLTGQVVADSIGHTALFGRRRPDGLHPRRGPGGRGAGDHRPAVDRRRRDGLADRRALREGAGVVTTRAHVRTVVTEWGVAELFGKSLRERAKALIAHRPPGFPSRPPSAGEPPAPDLERIRFGPNGPCRWRPTALGSVSAGVHAPPGTLEGQVMPPGLLVAGFLLAHAAIHVAFIAPPPPATADGPAWPFTTDRAWLVTRLGLDPALLHRWRSPLLP